MGVYFNLKGGKIKHRYDLIKGFAATMPEEALSNLIISVWSNNLSKEVLSFPEHDMKIEEDQVVQIPKGVWAYSE